MGTIRVRETTLLDGSKIREPYATICHNDFWVNNAMVKYENNRPVGAKIIDFQILDYSSPAKDLVFFIYSSIQMPFVTDNFDELVKLYHTKLVNILKSFNCDPSPFTYELLLQEMATEAKLSEFNHILMMLHPIYSQKGTVKELSEISEADMVDSELSDQYNVKLCYVVKEFAKKNWL